MNIVIIGCGTSSRIHIDAIRSVPEATLFGVCDVNETRAREVAQAEGIPKVYTDYRDVLRDPAVDIVNICLPSGLHGEICVAAAAAGKHIVCEKPLEIRPARVEAICEAVERSGVKMQVIFQRRTMPVARRVRELVREGAFGQIVLADAYLKYYRDQAYYDSASWRATWEMDGGGALMNQGIHGVDLLFWMLDDRAERVFGRAETLARKIRVEDTATALIKTEKGAQVVIEGTTSLYPAQPATFCIQGTRGSVIFDDEGILLWSFQEDGGAAPLPPRPDEGGAGPLGGSGDAAQVSAAGHAILIRDLIRAIEEDQEPMIPPRSARHATEVICGIYESSRTGREVTLGNAEN